jgi:hypothetical protein
MAKSSPEENARAVEGLRALQTSDGSPAISHSLIAWYTALGALDDAYAIAEESLRNARTTDPSGTAWGGIWTQNMRSFRRDGRFQGLVARLHFMPYWKANGQPNDCEISGDELICK